MQEFALKNFMQLPKLEKIVINFGLGEALKNAMAIEKTIEDIRSITGQAPVVAKAKKAIANFKIREGDSIGCYVTLRGDKCWDFLDRFVNIALPRLKDFRGLSRKSFDAAGNYSIGLKEQTIFPEIDSGAIDKLRGFEVTMVIRNSDNLKSYTFLKHLGIPFEKEK